MSADSSDTPLVCIVDVDAAAWDNFKAEVEAENEDGFRAYVRFIFEKNYFGLQPEALRDVFTEEDNLLILAADAMTFEHPKSPVLCIDPEGLSASFRAALDQLWIVENNLSIGNLLFEEVVDGQVVGGWLVPDEF